MDPLKNREEAKQAKSAKKNSFGSLTFEWSG